MGAKERTAHLDWLKEAHGDQVARILSNARCLSEGVDIPALDAILFMHPRKSQIDVVQSVGRVMRRAEGKHMGYVILPIGVPTGLIPVEAYEYVVNGKPALEWVMERQCVKTDKASGIVNDANRYAIETVGDPAYPLKLFQRVITVSLETMKIVRSLPSLDI